jgi:hypothetical protein
MKWKDLLKVGVVVAKASPARSIVEAVEESVSSEYDVNNAEASRALAAKVAELESEVADLNAAMHIIAPRLLALEEAAKAKPAKAEAKKEQPAEGFGKADGKAEAKPAEAAAG